jgi:hypothetical protein
MRLYLDCALVEVVSVLVFESNTDFPGVNVTATKVYGPVAGDVKQRRRQRSRQKRMGSDRDIAEERGDGCKIRSV